MMSTEDDLVFPTSWTYIPFTSANTGAKSIRAHDPIRAFFQYTSLDS